jgi:hypothetical protein
MPENSLSVTDSFTTNDVKEELSYAYIHAVAAAAGYSCDRPGKDRSSIDVTVTFHGKIKGCPIWRPTVLVQAKATTSVHLNEDADRFTFHLPVKNYNDLRQKSQAPSILVVLVMPKLRDQWLTIDANGLITRRCAFWCSLRGLPDTTNTRTRAVTVLTRNRFDVAALKAIMKASASQGTIDHES